MEETTSVMNTTNGDVVGESFETRDEALEWIENQDCPEMYIIMEETNQ